MVKIERLTDPPIMSLGIRNLTRLLSLAKSHAKNHAIDL